MTLEEASRRQRKDAPPPERDNQPSERPPNFVSLDEFPLDHSSARSMLQDELKNAIGRTDRKGELGRFLHSISRWRGTQHISLIPPDLSVFGVSVGHDSTILLERGALSRDTEPYRKIKVLRDTEILSDRRIYNEDGTLLLSSTGSTARLSPNPQHFIDFCKSVLDEPAFRGKRLTDLVKDEPLFPYISNATDDSGYHPDFHQDVLLEHRFRALVLKEMAKKYNAWLAETERARLCIALIGDAFDGNNRNYQALLTRTDASGRQRDVEEDFIKWLWGSTRIVETGDDQVPRAVWDDREGALSVSFGRNWPELTKLDAVKRKDKTDTLVPQVIAAIKAVIANDAAYSDMHMRYSKSKN